ncbi:sulfatase-like hydrolase/transferase [Thalassolituus sp. LLYu03]|uniref:sulfatase-like hydrolase/transferase n=1 Tax=Thalassolituus sp. LLYu03 TaxID=3421656 RepID=UPI003D2720DF
MKSLFSLIPLKILFLGITVFIWRSLFRSAQETHQKGLATTLLALSLLSVVLAVVSIGKVYPYGVVTDTLLFASACAIVMALPIRRLWSNLVAALVLVLIIAGPMIYLAHYQVVGGPVNKDSFIAVFLTSKDEALEYLSSFTSVLSLVPLILVAGLIYFLLRQRGKNATAAMKPLPAVAICLTTLVSILVMPLEKGLFSYPVVVFQSLQQELKVSQERLALFKDRNTQTYEATKPEKGEVYIVVVGESLNKHHMGIYGYEKQTTPELQALTDSGDLFVVKGSYSNYPGTMAALSHALTEANQRNGKHYTESVGIVELLNKAGFNTAWIGNQPLSNSYDMILGLIANEAKSVELTFDTKYHSMSHKNHQPDGVLLPLIEQALQSQTDDSSRVIFVHLMGNHTDYCERYPDEFKKYTISSVDAFMMHIFKGGLGHSIECYDNSVLYNDFVISSIISDLKTTLGESGVGGLLYFADHSDDVVRGVGHSTANYSTAMVESPAIVWLSDGYKTQYAEQFSALKNNQTQLFSNDFIFDSIVGLTGTRIAADGAANTVYCPSCDLMSSSYSLPAGEAKTMHGKLAYEQPAKAGDQLESGIAITAEPSDSTKL